MYRDPFAKPEMLCALTSFDTLCGFRPVDDTVSLLHEIDAHDLAVFLQHEKLASDGRRAVPRRVRHDVDDRGLRDVTTAPKPTW